MDNYNDIIGLGLRESRFPRMAMSARAAQFAPFAGLELSTTPSK